MNFAKLARILTLLLILYQPRIANADPTVEDWFRDRFFEETPEKLVELNKVVDPVVAGGAFVTQGAAATAGPTTARLLGTYGGPVAAFGTALIEISRRVIADTVVYRGLHVDKSGKAVEARIIKTALDPYSKYRYRLYFCQLSQTCDHSRSMAFESEQAAKDFLGQEALPVRLVVVSSPKPNGGGAQP